MKAENIGIWVQVITLIAVLAGLGLVVWELQQTRELTRLQISQGTFTELSADLASIYGEVAAATLGRACLAPEKLSEEELVVLDAYFTNQMARILRLKNQVDLADFDTDWRRAGIPVVRRILGHPQGRRWLIAFMPSAEAQGEVFAQFLAEQIEGQPRPCSERLNALKPEK